MLYKIDLLQIQLQDFELTDGRLRGFLYDCDFFWRRTFKRELFLTHVHRTEEEQKGFYPKFFEENGFVKPSGHLLGWHDKDGKAINQRCRAGDARSKDVPQGQIDALQKYIAPTWGKAGFLILQNDRGEAHPHLHFQCPKLPA